MNQQEPQIDPIVFDVLDYVDNSVRPKIPSRQQGRFDVLVDLYKQMKTATGWFAGESVTQEQAIEHLALFARAPITPILLGDLNAQPQERTRTPKTDTTPPTPGF